MSGLELLCPGVRRVRPDDHFMMLAETDASPMHVGALLLFDVPDDERAGFAARIRRQFGERLAHTPLLAQLVEAPEGFDSDVWRDLSACDLDAHIRHVSFDQPLSDAGLRDWVARKSMDRLDLARPPFEAFVLDTLESGGAAVYFKMHHAVADGIGFQTVLRLLSDETAPAPPRAEGVLPSDEEWRALAEARFAAEEVAASEHRQQRKAALAALEAMKDDPAMRRARTPMLKLTGPTSRERAFATLQLPLDAMKATAKALDGTLNDLFLALAGSALRAMLIEIDDLPAEPIVVNSARSYRRPEHGDFGNRIVAQHPHIATHIADPIARLRAIQASMAVERARTHLDEAMLGAPEQPFGPRDRRAKFAARAASGGALLPGNITVSNVPGPAERPRYAGYPLRANFPVPIIGSARFLNITSRRNGPTLDLGLMADPNKLPDIGRVATHLVAAFEDYRALAGA